MRTSPISPVNNQDQEVIKILTNIVKTSLKSLGDDILQATEKTDFIAIKVRTKINGELVIPESSKTETFIQVFIKISDITSIIPTELQADKDENMTMFFRLKTLIFVKNQEKPYYCIFGIKHLRNLINFSNKFSYPFLDNDKVDLEVIEQRNSQDDF